MLPKLQAHYIQAFTNYKSSDGSLGVTALQAGIQFKNGLYVGGTFSAAGLPLTTDNITISGTAGNGYIQYAAQTVAPSLALVHTYADSGGHFAIGASGSTANDISFTNSLMTANRSYAFQDKTGTLAMVGDNVSEFTNDSGFVVGPGSAVSGRLPSFNGTTGKLIQDSGINIAGTSGKTLTLTGGLTIGADTSIGGGGVITLGGFILTVPATGTTALLAANNVFTGANSFSGVSPIISFVDSSGVTATFGDSAGFSGFSGNRNFATGTIYDTGKAAAAAYVFTGNGSSYVGWGTTQANNTAPTERMRLINGLSIGGATDPGAGGLILEAATANLYLKNTSTGFQAATSQIITPQSGNTLRNTAYVAGLVGWNMTDPGNAEFNNVDVRGAIHAGILAYNQIQTTAGTFLVTKSAAKLKTDAVVPSSPTYGTTTVNIDVVDPDGITHGSAQLFVVNDVLRLKDGLVGDTWFTVSSASDQTTFWRYVCKIQAGTNNVTYRAGLGVVDYGLSGAGFIMLTADQTNAPYLQMATHAATFTSANSSGTLVVTPQLRLGNLNGSYGYATNVYGFGVGNSTEYLTVDPTSGLRLVSVGGKVVVDSTGLVITSGTAVAQANSVTWKNGASTTAFIVNLSGASPGNPYGVSMPTGAGTSYSIIESAALSNSSGYTATQILTARAGGGAELAFGVYQDNAASETFADVSDGGTYAFKGLSVGGGVKPTHMLEVYGEGYFQSNVAIGTTSTGSVGGDGGTFTNLRVHNSTNYGLLTLSGPGTADGGNGGIISFGSTGAGSTDKRFVVINGTSDGSSASTTNGRLDIYTTNAGTSSLTFRLSKAGLLRLPGYGAGTLSTDASGNITASSDEKLKTNIRRFRKGLDTLKKLEPILYRWNKKSGLDTKTDYVGFGARHSKCHIPEAVGKGRDGFHTMSDRAILATAVNAIKELEQMYATR